MTDQTAYLLDIPALLADISQDLPCGDDTREDASPDSPYFTLKDLRSQARALERQVLADDELVHVPQWRQMAREIPVLLTKRTKDLEYTAWLIEALCREHGFLGLADGFTLARELLLNHWDNLHPAPDEEGPATRIAPLVGLNGLDTEGTLIQPILSVPLFQADDGGAYATWHAEQAAEVGRLDEDRALNRIKTGAASPEQLQAAVASTPVEDLASTREAILAAQQAFAELAEVMDEVMGEPQPTTNIRHALDRCLSVLAHHAGARIDEWARHHAPRDTFGQGTDAEPEILDEGGDTPAPRRKVDPVQAAIDSRTEALAELRRLSDFFLKTEPHSPVSYAIRQAVRWSDMTLPELMQELIDDNGARDGFYRLTGVPAPEPRE
ncbi:MAG: type VI secretion system protein TssA [Marinobacter sp.]